MIYYICVGTYIHICTYMHMIFMCIYTYICNKYIASIMLSEKRKKTQIIPIQIRNKKSVLTLSPSFQFGA